ncbi:hypothetical protein EVAR_96287_1 [Eumeta japonica]|uniref:Uncharacterized protein n=1 Tax=Eumeta variegata TaxID=151549 RepID=A0A4C1VWR4_EUMVA|nr:hypothetical protein EVAR_96287_1 [Eumeta japonica]
MEDGLPGYCRVRGKCDSSSGGATPLVDVGDIRREAVGGRRRRRRLAPPLVSPQKGVIADGFVRDMPCRIKKNGQVRARSRAVWRPVVVRHNMRSVSDNGCVWLRPRRAADGGARPGAPSPDFIFPQLALRPRPRPRGRRIDYFAFYNCDPPPGSRRSVRRRGA